MKEEFEHDLKLSNGIRSLSHLISISDFYSESELEGQWFTFLIMILDPVGLFKVHCTDSFEVKLLYSKEVTFDIDIVLNNLKKREASNSLFSQLGGEILIYDFLIFSNENKKQIFSGFTSVLFSHKHHLSYMVVFEGHRSSHVLELIRELYFLRDLIHKRYHPRTDSNFKKLTSDNDLERSGDKQLTERQELILRYLREGLTNREIARKIGFSEALIKAENTSIFRKLDIVGRQDTKLTSER